MIHECAHNLIFRGRLANMFSGMLANLPLALPSSVSFQRYHLRHHAFQGVYELDADLPSEWEARLVGRSPLAKAVWLAVYPALLVTRALRLKEVRIVDGWLLINLATVLAADGLVLLVLGCQGTDLFGELVRLFGRTAPGRSPLDSGALLGSFAARNVQLLRTTESRGLQCRLSQRASRLSLDSLEPAARGPQSGCRAVRLAGGASLLDAAAAAISVRPATLVVFADDPLVSRPRPTSRTRPTSPSRSCLGRRGDSSRRQSTGKSASGADGGSTCNTASSMTSGSRPVGRRVAATPAGTPK